MAEGPSSIEEELEVAITEHLVPGSHGKNQEHLMITEVIDCGPRSLGVPLRQQKLDPKTAGLVADQSLWNMTTTRPKKLGAHLPLPRMSRELDYKDDHTHEYPGSFQGMTFHYERSPEADIIAEIDMEEPNGLEMEAMRKELRVIKGRLYALEDQAATEDKKEAMFFAMLLSVCMANLWLWMRR